MSSGKTFRFPQPIFALTRAIGTRTGKLLLIGLTAIQVLLAAPGFATQLDDAATAYKKGDYDTALRLFRPLAEQGNSFAQYTLGLMYEWGNGVAQDDAEASKWYRLSAEGGFARAQASLGVLYQIGRGVPQNFSEAIKWYRLAADQGNARAQSNLGFLFHYGQGVPQNNAEALKWYRLSAAQGNAPAQFNLAVMYENGQGVTADKAEAMRLYLLAADQGYARAQSGLGAMYADSEHDYVHAYMWTSLAAAQGYRNALDNQAALERLMTSAQIAEAKKLASEWKAKPNQ